MSQKEIIKRMFDPDVIRELAEAEDRAACKTCGRVVLCGKVVCENSPCELKARRIENA